MDGWDEQNPIKETVKKSLEKILEENYVVESWLEIEAEK